MSNSKGTPRSPRINYHFKRPEFDFMFQWAAGSQTNGGVELGECFYAASQIKEGDEESWISAWEALGERVLKRAEASMVGGHPVSARESYLRAYSYYRIPLVFISPVLQPERYRDQYCKARNCFQRAAALFDPPLERLEIPFEGKHLPGYFLPADKGGDRRKSLIMIGGGDTFVEDLYEKAEHSLLYRLAKTLIVRWRSAYATMVDTYVWRFGAESVPDLIPVTKTAQVDPVQITCPTLNVMSEQEYDESPQFRGFAEVSQEKISHPIQKLVVLPGDEGADSHAIGTNLSLMSQTVFDWLDEVLDYTEARRRVKPAFEQA